MFNLEKCKELHPKDYIKTLETFGKSLPFVSLEDADKVNFAQVHLETKHHFSLGIYARELFIPKGSMIVGKLHKCPQLNIMTKGDISVLVGEEIKRLQAGAIVSSPAGTQRVAFAHEDSVWITILATNETDVDVIEDKFIAKDEQDYLDFQKQLLLDI